MEDLAAYYELQEYSESRDSSCHLILKDNCSTREDHLATGSSIAHAITHACKEEGNGLKGGEGDDFVPRAAVAHGEAPSTVRISDVFQPWGIERKLCATKNADRPAKCAIVCKKFANLNPSDYADSEPFSSSSSLLSQSSFKPPLYSSPSDMEGKNASENRQFLSESSPKKKTQSKEEDWITAEDSEGA